MAVALYDQVPKSTTQEAMRKPGYFESESLNGVRENVSLDEQLKYEQIMARVAAHPATQDARARFQEVNDSQTAEHTERVTELALRLGIRLKLPDDMLVNLGVAGEVHDVGKAEDPRIQAAIYKPGRLLPDEFSLVKRHPELSVERAKAHGASDSVAILVSDHHAHRRDPSSDYFGRDDLKPRFEEEKLAAQILATVDPYDARRSQRPERAVIPGRDEALVAISSLMNVEPRIQQALAELTILTQSLGAVAVASS